MFNRQTRIVILIPLRANVRLPIDFERWLIIREYGLVGVVPAIERGAETPEAIRNQLEATHNFAGIGGVFNYSAVDHAGLTKDAFVLVEVKKKSWTLVK